jgi:hypothetical protein
MKKWKDISNNEKWMMILIVLLLIGIIIRWAAVKDGISRGFNWFGDEETETVPPDSTQLEMIVPPDTFPIDQQDIQLITDPENE